MAALTLVKHTSILGAVVLVIIIVLFLGRAVGFPAAVMIVSGRSMEPALKVGDLVLCVRSSFKVDDIVVWCVGPTYCVIHRVIEVTGNSVVTKGDNNPAPDPPIPKSFVKYKAVLVVPRYLWVSVVLAVFAAYAYANRRYLLKRKLLPGEVLSLVLITFIVFNAAIALLAPTYYPARKAGISVPQIGLARIRVLNNASVLLSYRVHGTYLINTTSCRAWIRGELNNSVDCTAKVVGPSEILVSIPVKFLEQMFRAGERSLVLRLSMQILFGKVLGRYYVYVPWRELNVSAVNGALVVRNPNPVPLVVNITFYLANKPGIANVTTKTVIISAGGEVEFNLSKYKYARANVEYLFLGKKVTRHIRVRP